MVSEGVHNTSKLGKVGFAQNPSNAPNRIPYCKRDKGYLEYKTRPKKPKIIDLVSTSLSRSARLADKLKYKYGLFDKFSLAVIGACEAKMNPHIFLTIGNQHIQ